MFLSRPRLLIRIAVVTAILVFAVTVHIWLRHVNRCSPVHGLATSDCAHEAGRLTKLCRKHMGVRPWLLVCSYSQDVHKTSLLAFLPPSYEEGRVRRGRVYYDGEVLDYAQVAFTGPFAFDVQKIHLLDLPFLKYGEFSDEDLVGIVEAVRDQFDARQFYLASLSDAVPESLQRHKDSLNVDTDAVLFLEAGATFRWYFLSKKADGWVSVGTGGGIR